VVQPSKGIGLNGQLYVEDERPVLLGKTTFVYLALVVLVLTSACVGGAGWDATDKIEKAKRYPTTESNRITIQTEEVPPRTFHQEFETVFTDFPFSGKPVDNGIAPISGTPYSVSYQNFVLRIFREKAVVAERNLPEVFYMHPMSSAAIVTDSPKDDVILCRTHSRSTTGLHYVLITDGSGEILFEKVLGAAEDWDVLLGSDGVIVIGGARTKTTISKRR
jgi:hypothetical protein